MINVSTENKCLFTDTNIEDAYGPEVSLFLHCHLRAYDKTGDGKFRDQGDANHPVRSVIDYDLQLTIRD